MQKYLNKIFFIEDRDTFFVTWSLHNFCNFRCSYCPPNLNNGTTTPIDMDVLARFVDRIQEIAPGNKIIFAFSGGEPTLHPQFIEMIKYLNSRGCEITMTTNGSRGLDWWKEAEPYIDHLVISYHANWTKPEKLARNIDFLIDTCWVNLDLMMEPEHWDTILELGEQFKGRKNIQVTYLPIQKDFGVDANGLIDYTPDQLEFLRNPPNYLGEWAPAQSKIDKCNGLFGRGDNWMEIVEDGKARVVDVDYKYLIANDMNRFKGYKCNLGLEGVIIEINGDIYKGYCHVGGKVGNIYEGVLNLDGQPVICPKEYCSCAVDIEISKERL